MLLRLAAPVLAKGSDFGPAGLCDPRRDYAVAIVTEGGFHSRSCHITDRARATLNFTMVLRYDDCYSIVIVLLQSYYRITVVLL